ncbi:uncharacterized protein B0H18DRAFT_1004090 [Fomitopsis serialis]|uniref:uncharacterized protein n=1 Tax=Fomitopsis serialis TaxID=139415 RepID=UPI0020075FEC|nr:uncharacterized protein B0H18DRAFT_1004090 [Neoantrodia serialis]KAH9927322.1 hypothetical protein B0H18DRAFT_1004090 [Neoantrodia serialis]
MSAHPPARQCPDRSPARLPVRSLAYLSTRPFTRMPIRSLVHSSVRPFVHPLVRSPIRSPRPRTYHPAPRCLPFERDHSHLPQPRSRHRLAQAPGVRKRAACTLYRSTLAANSRCATPSST